MRLAQTCALVRHTIHFVAMQHLKRRQEWLNSGQMSYGLKYGHQPEAARGGLRVGGVRVGNGVFLAPMSGITDSPFRRQASELGAGLVVSEMTACAALAHGHPDMRRRVEAHAGGIHVVQLAGCEAHWMAEGARIARDAGAEIIDINMGCPAACDQWRMPDPH